MISPQGRLVLYLWWLLPAHPSPVSLAEVGSVERSAAISSSWPRAVRRSSTISSAIWSGGGRVAESSMLSSRSQKMSRLALSRFRRSS